MATVVTTIKSAKEVLASLRKEPFCIEYVEKLVNHRVVQVSKAGTLPLKVMAAFLCEQYYIVSADIRSMEHLVSRCEDSDVIGQYFSFFYNGQKLAHRKLLTMAKAMGLSELDLENYEPQASAQGYPSYFCYLAHYGEIPQIVAAIAVNFPTFGQMCSSLEDSMKKKYDMKREDLDFLRFFGVCDLDEGAVKVIEAFKANDKGKMSEIEYKSIRRAVRLLQAYEVMFLDSIYESSVFKSKDTN
ncbi:unnamed protein product [Porites lobata]|uniref:Thiaminase-2/PQQC domain-containing protein n=1 Tax=Porites lobata TaxID=104759 RepID=A0ABN8NNY1_9CNID|nr:unnamed protein product [Porites lobata]